MSIINKIVFFFTILAVTNVAFAESWINLHSERFEILISEKYRDEGLQIAKLSERALDQLSNIYSEKPKGKILVVVDHRTNSPNGSATHFPYPHIIIYPTPPTSYSSIGEYNEWVYELILHELVHFLTFFPNHGIYRPIQFLLGNLFAPNFILLPSWFHEGLAVSLETHLTQGGRMRSEHYKEMYKVLSSRLTDGSENLSSINERYIPAFPYGQRPYFYGALVVNQTTQHKHAENLDDMIQGFSRAIPPYNLRSSVKRNFGQTFSKFRQAVTSFKLPASIEKKYSREFMYQGHSPIWIDDHRFITVNVNKDLFEELVEYDLSKPNNSKGKLLLRTLGTTRISVSADKSNIIYDQVVPYKRIYNITDLFLLDLKTNKSQRLTYGAQLREASFSKNSSSIVAVQTDLTKTRLVQLDQRNPEKLNSIYNPTSFETRVSAPNFIDNDQKIIFIEKKSGKKPKIKILDLASGHIKTLDFSNSFSQIFWLELQNDTLLLHAKEKGKPRQHYLLDDRFRPQQVTFDHIGTRSAALRNNQILVTHLSSNDYVTAYYENFKTEVQTDLRDFDITLSKNLLFPEPGIQERIETKQKKYSFLDYMIPQYWFPFITPNYGGFSGQSLFSISTGSSDPLGINSYSVNLRQDTISDRLSGGVNIVHVNKNVIWGFSANQFEAPLTEEISRTFQSLGASARFDLGHERGRGHALTLGLNHIDAKLENIERIKSFGPQISHSYNSLRHEASRVAPSRGIYTNLSFSHHFGHSDYLSYNFLEGYYEKYFSRFLIPANTSLKFFSKAIYSDEYLPTVFTPVNMSGYFSTSRQQNSFVVRGYPSGLFQAREGAFTIGAEYYFPLLNIFSGPEFLPIFFRRIFGAIVADAGSYKGRGFDGVSAFIDHSYDEIYYGAGFEVHAELTIGHYIPIKFSLGIYNALNAIENIEPTQVFLNFTTPALP